MVIKAISRRLLTNWTHDDRISYTTGFRMINPVRWLSNGEVATALRPFYFSVHPDLFGQHPSERITNENSLKMLSSYMQTIQQNKPARPTTLTFYLRTQGVSLTKGLIKPVKIKLGQRDVRKTVVSILSTCNLPTTYVDNIPIPVVAFNNANFKFKFNFNENDETAFYVKETVNKSNANQSLITWLSKQCDVAKERSAACEPVREDILKLQQNLCSKLGLKDVLWECGWDITHFRGCLLSFSALANHHPNEMSSLRGRILIFGSDTGLSRDGDILLNCGEVRNNWFDFIKNVSYHHDALNGVPSFEKSVSRVLRDIKIVRRKFQPKTMARQYQNCLRRLTTNLNDFQGRHSYPRSWPKSLENFELVVETEAGPLMLSPTGQFIVPCSCPSFLLVNFLTENMQKASELLKEYEGHKHVEKQLHARVMKQFKLSSLDKDDCITPSLMIKCLKSLLDNQDTLKSYLENTHLAVTNYYSVMSDGKICIPWNWKLNSDKL